MTGHKIDEHTFKKIKGSIFWKMNVYQAAAKYDLSAKTVLQIRGSKSWSEYRQQNLAQHPEIQYSLADNVLHLHKIILDARDNKYLPPSTARRAVEQLKLKFIKET